MSNLQSRLGAVKFEPVVAERPEPAPPPGEAILIFGVIYPAVIIALELISGMCANAFFDPLPTYWHAAVAGLVPASNRWSGTACRTASGRAGAGSLSPTASRSP